MNFCCQQSIFRTHPLGAVRLASIEKIKEMPETEEEMKGEMKKQSWGYDRVSISELEPSNDAPRLESNSPSLVSIATG